MTSTEPNSSSAIFVDALEFPNTILLCKRLLPEGAEAEKNVMELFDTETGECVSSYELPPVFSGRLRRMEKAADVAGFDFRCVYDDGMLYKSSADAQKELRYELPAGIVPTVSQDPFDGGAYDVAGDQLVYTQSDGIWLADRDGLHARKVLSNAEITFMEVEKMTGETKLMYGKPRFLCKCTKIAAGICDSGDWYGTVLYYPETGEMENWLQTLPPFVPSFPYTDRYIKASKTAYLDACTNVWSEFPTASGNAAYLTYDFQTFVYQQYDMRLDHETEHLEAYRCSSTDPTDRTAPILVNLGNEPVILCCITENYVVAHAPRQGDWWAIAKYR